MPIPTVATKFKSGNSKPFITLRERFITFSKTAIEQLEYAPLINMFVMEKEQKVYFQVCNDPHDEDALKFYKERPGKQLLVRVSSKGACNLLIKIARIEKCGENGVRFYGEYLPEDHAIEIDLSKPVK